MGGSQAMIRLRRAAMEDALAVLEWRNDPDTIEMSKTLRTVTPAEHMKWFSGAINDPNRIILIALEDERRLGMVRFDKVDDGWLVSMNLAATERRRGYGYSVLSNALTTIGSAPLLAEIRASNSASRRVFKKCGFYCQRVEDGFEYWRRD